MIRVTFGTKQPVPYTSPDMPGADIFVTAHGVVAAEMDDTESNRTFISDAASLLIADVIARYSGTLRISYLRSKTREISKQVSDALREKLHFTCSVNISSINTNAEGSEPVTPTGSEPMKAAGFASAGYDAISRPKFCSECGGRLPESGKFCPECGNKL